MNSKTIALTTPLKTKDGRTLESLSMREPKVRDMRIAQKAGDAADQEITMFANLCEVTAADLDELNLPDYAKVQSAFRDFSGSAET
jgi:hypothetical protein